MSPGGEAPRSPEDRIAHNEGVFRDVNERIADGQWPGDPNDPVAFRCECGRLGCNMLVELTLAVYEQVRSDPRHFVLVAGHDTPEVEVVIGQGEGYVIVEKIGRAGEIAEATDPR